MQKEYVKLDAQGNVKILLRDQQQTLEGKKWMRGVIVLADALHYTNLFYAIRAVRYMEDGMRKQQSQHGAMQQALNTARAVITTDKPYYSPVAAKAVAESTIKTAHESLRGVRNNKKKQLAKQFTETVVKSSKGQLNPMATTMKINAIERTLDSVIASGNIKIDQVKSWHEILTRKKIECETRIRELQKAVWNLRAYLGQCLTGAQWDITIIKRELQALYGAQYRIRQVEFPLPFNKWFDKVREKIKIISETTRSSITKERAHAATTTLLRDCVLMILYVQTANQLHEITCDHFLGKPEDRYRQLERTLNTQLPDNMYAILDREGELGELLKKLENALEPLRIKQSDECKRRLKIFLQDVEDLIVPPEPIEPEPKEVTTTA